MAEGGSVREASNQHVTNISGTTDILSREADETDQYRTYQSPTSTAAPPRNGAQPAFAASVPCLCTRLTTSIRHQY